MQENVRRCISRKYTHGAFDHELNLSVGHSHDDRHALSRARELQHIQDLITLLSAHLNVHIPFQILNTQTWQSHDHILA